MSQEKKFLDSTGLAYYNTKIHEYIETRPVDLGQVKSIHGLTVLFDENFEAQRNPVITDVQSWAAGDVRREIRTSSGNFNKDGTYINIYSTPNTTLAPLRNLADGDSFTIKVGNQTYTGTIVTYDYYQAHDYQVDFGGFKVSWPRTFDEEYDFLSFWPYYDNTYDGCAILNASTSVEFVNISATQTLTEYIAAEDNKVKATIETAKAAAVAAAVEQAENKWFNKHQFITGLPELDWCLFEPQYSEKIVLSYTSDDPTEPDIDIDLNGR